MLVVPLDPGVIALALVAGAVAAFNPCGFALLPAYLSLLVASPPGTAGSGGSGRAAAIGRAARFTAGMTTGFVAVFGLFGLVLAPLALSLERYLPVVTVAVGGTLAVLGAWLLTGRSLALPALGGRGRGRGRAPSRTWTSQVGYGVTYALASLSCTVAPFLAVTAGALRAGGPAAVTATYLAYAAGMGAVVGGLALAAATAGATVTARLRRGAPIITRLSGALLVVAGTYVAWYGWFELRVLSGAAAADPVVGAATRVQSAITRAVAATGVPGVVGLAAGVVVVVLLAAGQRRRRANGAGAAAEAPVGADRRDER